MPPLAEPTSHATIRLLLPSDAEAFAALRLAVAAESEVSIGCTYAEEAARPIEEFRQQLAFPLGATFGAFSGGELVGSASVMRPGVSTTMVYKAFIWGVQVLPSHRKQAIARRLMEAILQHARQGGARRINLTVYVPNAAATSLYESFGFVAYGQEPEAICIGERYYDALFMTLPAHAESGAPSGA